MTKRRKALRKATQFTSSVVREKGLNRHTLDADEIRLLKSLAINICVLRAHSMIDASERLAVEDGEAAIRQAFDLPVGMTKARAGVYSDRAREGATHGGFVARPKGALEQPPREVEE